MASLYNSLKSDMLLYHTLILDVSSLLVQTSDLPQDTRLLLHNIQSSAIWAQYEKGRITAELCYTTLSHELSVEVSKIDRALRVSRASRACNIDFINLLRQIRKSNSSASRFFAAGNASQDEFEQVKQLFGQHDWEGLFDGVFPSWQVGARKPELSFFKHIISAAQIDASCTIYIDSSPDSVLGAVSQGFHGILYQGLLSSLEQSLANLLHDPVERGQGFLKGNAGALGSVCDGAVVQENFSQLLILELTGDMSLVSLVRKETPGRWHFFQEKLTIGQFTTAEFPFDLDTTSVGLTNVKEEDTGLVMSVMDKMLDYVDEDGIVQTYFDHNRRRIDPVVCVNVLSLFLNYSRIEQLDRTLQWVYEVLLNRAYIHGTRYYTTAEAFLFFLCRMLRQYCPSSSGEIRERFLPLLKERISERVGTAADALNLAMRVIICDYVGVKNEVDYRDLRSAQQQDGGWEAGGLYRFGNSGYVLKNRGLTTAMAIQAIREHQAGGYSQIL
ncbi:hypothetical protein V5O48_013070 [Marasmius crinis-equi]|uniref:HAD-like protein n=1 Tax=Marasmius crinis-equi TaxID=585013 RepID=A0ABR3F187_9AGAR